MSQEKKIICSSSEKEELQDKQMLINNEFCEENGIADLTLIVENHKIPVSKTVLCIASPVFRTMFEGHFREKTETEIPLPGKSYKNFVEFLRFIYPDQTNKVKEMSSETNINNEFHRDGKFVDVTLVVENHKIPVCKAVLCIASPVFCAMFDGDFKEKTEKEIPLPGKSYGIFVEFLRCIYPDKMKKITEKNVYMLLPLAHEYNVVKMMKHCQKVLQQKVKNRQTSNVEELYRHIHLSELYSLEELKDKCIYLASEYTLKQVKAARTANQISDASYIKIIELALKRHELDKTDEKVFEIHNAKKYGYFNSSKTTHIINCELKGNFDMDKENKDMFRMIRLIERFKITTSDPDMKSMLLKQLQTVYRRGECIEEFDLLPENVKDALQNNS